MWQRGLFASLAFDKEDVENQEWIKRRFIVLQDIFRDTPAYQYTLEEGREEERQRHLRAQRSTVLTIIQARFPTLNKLAQKQTAKIKDVKIIERVLAGVGSALTLEDAQHALLNWPDTDSN
jgi:uncharacterized protein (UPF0303 family)